MDRHPPGRIRDAIVQFLTSTGEAITVKEIIDGVASELGHEVTPSSVRSYLRLRSGDLFERVERGLYRLQLDEEQAQYRLELPRLQQPQPLLVQDDCIEWLRKQPKQSISAVVTDPPYGLLEYSPVQQAKLKNGKGGVWRIPPSFDGHKRAPLPRFTTLTCSDLEALDVFFSKWVEALLPILVPGANVIVASNPLVSDRVSRVLAKAGLERRGEIVRLVMTMRGGDRPKNAHKEFPDVSVMPRSMWEPWLCFRKPLEGRAQDNLRKWKTGGFRRISKDRPFGDVITSHPTRPKERQIAPHPSLKPQSFLRQIVRAVLPLGEGIVLDPFAGSGSTLAAAMAVGYQSVGVENDPEFYRIAERAIIPLSQIKT